MNPLIVIGGYFCAINAISVGLMFYDKHQVRIAFKTAVILTSDRPGIMAGEYQACSSFVFSTENNRSNTH
jgi:hypothetical protein